MFDIENIVGIILPMLNKKKVDKVMKLKVYKTEKPRTTYLQGVAGWVEGSTVGELNVGDHVVWNGGHPNPVIGFDKETKCFRVVRFYCSEIDKEHTRKMKRTRIVARPWDEIKGTDTSDK